MARSAGKKAVAIMHPFAQAVDLLMQAYNRHVASDSAPDPLVAVINLEHNSRLHTIARGRLRSAAFGDFFEEKLRVVGHTPLPKMPADISTTSSFDDMVAKMRADFKYVIVHCPEGQPPSIKFPKACVFFIFGSTYAIHSSPPPT